MIKYPVNRCIKFLNSINEDLSSILIKDNILYEGVFESEIFKDYPVKEYYNIPKKWSCLLTNEKIKLLEVSIYEKFMTEVEENDLNFRVHFQETFNKKALVSLSIPYFENNTKAIIFLSYFDISKNGRHKTEVYFFKKILFKKSWNIMGREKVDNLLDNISYSFLE